MKAYKGSRSITPLTLTLDLEVNGKYHGSVTFPQAKKLGTHWIGGCVGPGDGLHDFAEQKSFTKYVTECDTPYEWVSPVIASSNQENPCPKIGARGGAVG